MRGLLEATCNITGLGPIPRILFATDGAITHILEAYVGERVDLVRVTSAPVTDPAERAAVGLEGDERGLRRKSLLQGRRTGRVFVHSESVVFLDRLLPAVADELEQTGTSLLKLLTGRRIGTFRESIAEWEGTDEQIAACFGIDPSETHVARTYQIVVQGRPVARVTESFPKHRFAPPPEPASPAEVAVVTGGGRGIGRAVARSLAAAGHPVCVNDTGVEVDGRHPDPGPAQAVAEEIRRAGGRALAVATDARTSAGAAQLVAEVEAWAGRGPTILVHAAGTLRDGMAHKAADDDWSEVLGSHLCVAVELTRAMAGAMRSSRWGRIVYVGGAAGLVGSVGQAAYAVAKAGLFGLTRAMALELAGRDVCVNYVAPFAWTRMTETIPPANDQLRAYLQAAGTATPDDVAPLVAWLCSAAAAGISGQVLGGRGAEIALWSQPRPVVRWVEEGGWDDRSLTERAAPAMGRHLTPLESEFDLFGGPPVAVVRRQPA